MSKSKDVPNSRYTANSVRPEPVEEVEKESHIHKLERLLEGLHLFISDDLFEKDNESRVIQAYAWQIRDLTAAIVTLHGTKILTSQYVIFRSLIEVIMKLMYCVEDLRRIEEAWNLDENSLLYAMKVIKSNSSHNLSVSMQEMIAEGKENLNFLSKMPENQNLIQVVQFKFSRKLQNYHSECELINPCDYWKSIFRLSSMATHSQLNALFDAFNNNPDENFAVKSRNDIEEETLYKPAAHLLEGAIEYLILFIPAWKSYKCNS